MVHNIKMDGRTQRTFDQRAEIRQALVQVVHLPDHAVITGDDQLR